MVQGTVWEGCVCRRVYHRQSKGKNSAARKTRRCTPFPPAHCQQTAPTQANRTQVLQSGFFFVRGSRGELCTPQPVPLTFPFRPAVHLRERCSCFFVCGCCCGASAESPLLLVVKSQRLQRPACRHFHSLGSRLDQPRPVACVRVWLLLDELRFKHE